MVYSNTRMVFLVSCIFSLLEVLDNAFEVQFFRASNLPPITDTDSMQGITVQIFFKVETLLSNVFKGSMTHLQNIMVGPEEI